MKKAANDPSEGFCCIECGREIAFAPYAQLSRLKDNQAPGIKAYTKRYQRIGMLPWCSECVTRQFEALVSQMGGDLVVALFYLCRILDFPFCAEFIDRELSTPSEFLDKYLSDIRRMKNSVFMQGFMAGDAIRERDVPVFVEAEVLAGQISDYGASSEMNDWFIKWGRNSKYTEDDYRDLEQLYQNIASQSGIIVDEKTGRAADGVTDVAIIEAACNLLESRKCRKQGRADDAKRYYELYDKAMASQLLRGRDVKDKQVSASLVQDIVQYCEQDGFIEPWDKMVKYPHKLDVVDQVLLHITNHVRRICADIFNIHAPKMNNLPKEMKLDPKNDAFEGDTDFEKQFQSNLHAIADFKASQHFTDDEWDETDSADTDADTDSDEALFGAEEE